MSSTCTSTTSVSKSAYAGSRKLVSDMTKMRLTRERMVFVKFGVLFAALLWSSRASSSATSAARSSRAQASYGAGACNRQQHRAQGLELARGVEFLHLGAQHHVRQQRLEGALDLRGSRP